jgi:hypothetical protein
MILEGPINNLSLGNVTFNIARELSRRDELKSMCLPQCVNQISFQSFDRADENLKREIINKIQNFNKEVIVDDVALKIWHINGCERRVAKKQILFSFYEVDMPTETEINLVNQQDAVIFSSTEAIDAFLKTGKVNPDKFYFVPLGFDEDFYVEDVKKPDVIHFGICGKLEKRKNTQTVIREWLKLYGNNNKYQLTCLINNPFFPKETFDQIIINTLEGKHYSNINFLPTLETNSQVNQFINSLDIDLSGCCGNEGWNLPSFNAACMNKVCVVGLGGAHLDWVNEFSNSNLIKLEPSGIEECYDGVFFHRGMEYNQGCFHYFRPELISAAIKEAEYFFVNNYKEDSGKELREFFTYEKTVNSILNIAKQL